MRLNKTRGLLAGLILLAGGYAAIGAGLWQTLPIIGGASYCASYIGSPTGQGTITGTGGGTTTPPAVCGQTVPAGPATLTGSEVLPVDLYTPGVGPIFAGGPTTALIPLSLLSPGNVVVQTTGASVTLGNLTGTQIFNGVGATEAVTMPPAPFNGQRVQLANSTSTAIATFSVTANTGQSLVGVAPTNLAAETNNSAAGALSQVEYIYQASNTTWYRIQ